MKQILSHNTFNKIISVILSSLILPASIKEFGIFEGDIKKVLTDDSLAKCLEFLNNSILKRGIVISSYKQIISPITNE
jgi:hypothetical protein